MAADSPLDEVFRDDEAAVYSHEAALPPGDYYTIPFRTLVPRAVRNLLFAGRARSVDLAAYATGRGMPQCMLMGQAAGVGAAMALRAGCDVQDIDRAGPGRAPRGARRQRHRRPGAARVGPAPAGGRADAAQPSGNNRPQSPSTRRYACTGAWALSVTVIRAADAVEAAVIGTFCCIGRHERAWSCRTALA